MKHELEIKKEIEVERIRQESEKAIHLAKVREGVLSGEDKGGRVSRSSVYHFDVNNLRLLPKFNEKDPG